VLLGGEGPFGDLTLVGRRGGGELRPDLRPLLGELRPVPVCRQGGHVVPDEHLGVSVRAGADTDVGMSTDSAVARAATSAGTISRTTKSAPASATARVSASSCSAASPRPCTLNPESALTDCGVKPMWAHTGMPAATSALIRGSDAHPALDLDHGGTGASHHLRSGPDRLLVGRFVRAEREVGDNQCIACAPRTTAAAM
jgi:hypothetical protein